MQAASRAERAASGAEGAEEAAHFEEKHSVLVEVQATPGQAQPD